MHAFIYCNTTFMTDPCAGRIDGMLCLFTLRVYSIPGDIVVLIIDFITICSNSRLCSQGHCFFKTLADKLLLLEVPWDLSRYRRPSWMTSSAQERYPSVTSRQGHFVENVCSYVAITVPADGLVYLQVQWWPGVGPVYIWDRHLNG